MEFTDILGLLGGLAMFLYGMHLMGDGLELLAGAKLKSILEKLTSNRFLAMLVGLVMTAVIQSSNAVTAMTVNFVNVGLLDFSRAIGVIMGSNIGTTVTGQLIALNVTALAPLFAFLGVLFMLFTKKEKLRYTGQVVAGLGILFMGMSTMSSSMSPLKDIAWFQSAMTSFTNPFIGVAVGALFTLLIQSSSASVGVLQAMAMQGLIGLDSAIYIICGQNIGCTIAAIMAAFGGTKAAKRTALVHLLFNISGTILFILVAEFTPFVSFVEGLTPGNGVAQIANAHTIFNISTTAVLLPCANLLAKLAILLIPGEDMEIGPRLLHIKPVDPNSFGSTALAIEQVDAEVKRMHRLASDNLHAALDALFEQTPIDIETVYKNEETIDFLNKEITLVLVDIHGLGVSRKEAAHVSAMYHVLSDIERIGDHAENIADYAKSMRKNGEMFSEHALEELRTLTDMVYAIMEEAFTHFFNPASSKLQDIDDKEEAIDDQVEAMQLHHIDRLENNRCTANMGMVYVEILTDLERVSDHALNIAQAAHK